MSAFTFFKALEKIAELESTKKKGRIKIPDYFIKLILMNKTKLLRDQLNKKILKELFVNRHLISKNYNQPKMPNFFLANQKYKSLQKISRNLENAKSSSPLPKIDQRRSLLNLRYKETMKINNNDTNSNNISSRKEKETINIKTRRSKLLNSNNFSINNLVNNHSINANKNNIKTELVIPNKNVKELYCITRRISHNNKANPINIVNNNANNISIIKDINKDNNNTNANNNDNINANNPNNNINNNINNNANNSDNNNINDNTINNSNNADNNNTINANNNSVSKNNNNNYNNSESKSIKKNTFHEQLKNKGKAIIPTELTFENPESNNLRMTFITPISRSICFNQLEKSNLGDFIMNELCKNNSSKKFSQKIDINNITSKNYFPKVNINFNSEQVNNYRNSERIKEYNYYQLKSDKINYTLKDKDNYKNTNVSSVLEKTNNNDENIDNDLNTNNVNNNTINEEESIITKKNIIINIRKHNLKEFQMNMKPVRKFNSSFNNNNIQAFSTRKLKKITLQNNSSSKSNQMSLIRDFKNRYISPPDFEKKLNKKIILFPLNTNISLNNPNDKFYYFINKMYRNQLIEYMQHRINWELIPKINPEDPNPKIINFSWKYLSNRLNFKNYKYEPNKASKKLRMVNLFERNYEVGNKKNMFINLINYCDQININAFNLVPFTMIINNTKDVDYCLEAISDIIAFVNKHKGINKNIITNKKYNDIFWFDKNFESLKRQYINIDKNFLSQKNYWILKPTDLYQGKCIEISNSFEEISKKCRNMFKGVEKKFVPEEIIREEDLSDDENNITTNNNNNVNINLNNINNINSGKILSTINEEAPENKINLNINTNNTNINNTTNTNNNLTNLTNTNKKKAYSKMYCSNEIVIQKYLDNPLLYYKRKFDIRCFVLVDSNLNVFFCKEGHLKASSEFYDLSCTNKLIHITNYSLQKKSSKFEQYEDGNEISYNDFKKFLGEKNIPLDKFDTMLTQMKYLVEISFKSVGKKMLKTNPVLCFEIFGYDFIIDNDFKPWILEINNNPGLCISSPVIQKLVPRMLDDAFRLTIDKVFDTRYSPDVIDEDGKYKTKYKLDGFNDEENVFEFLCNVN